MGTHFAAIKGAAAEMGFTVAEENLGKYSAKIKEIEGLIRQVDEGEDGETPCDTERRDKGFRPQGENNTHGQWAWRCYIDGSKEAENGSGILRGKKVAIKDSIAVAGIPMTCGNEHLKDFIPSFDAIVVERVLSSGGSIVGKATAENLCHSPFSHSSCQGTVHNPYDPTRTSGGSSSGNAVALALREVDMAVGSDSGCSVRAPAALCGCVGLKPTYGLVPTNGGAPCLWSTNHYGPMASNVEDCALLLDAIAGPDLFACPVAAAINRPNSYLDDINKGINGLKAAILTEGFLYDTNDNSNISQTVHTMIDKLRNIGMEAEEVSFPEFAEARPMLFLLASIEFGYVVNNNGQPYPGRNFSMLDLKTAFKGIHKFLPQNAQIALLATKLFSQDIWSKNIVEKTINRAKLLSNRA
ncbi:urethanase-like isoform X3 [Convolutriloba macropyga]|uniref:urethanase-like isoform X3 n=1 Tax=Convolutriloba macropyga TaxID=536237 RepID=UPI003F526485